MEKLVECPICDLSYVSPVDSRLHKARHKKCLAAIEKYSFFYGYGKRDEMKQMASRIIHDEKADFQSKVDAMDVNLQAYFSRSLDGSGFSLRHPRFEEYAAMLLNDPGIWLGSIPKDVYMAVCAKYGTKPGFEPGHSYWVPPKKEGGRHVILSHH